MHTKALFEAALGLPSPWYVSSVDFDAAGSQGQGQLDIHIDFERGGLLPCRDCGERCSAHDTAEHRWRHLDFFQHVAYLHARVPRVKCKEHGVHKVEVPWARPGSGFTLLFEALVMALAQEMPVAAIARLVREHDTRLWRIVKWHVADARKRVDMSEVQALVVDETSRARHRKYVSLFLEPARVREDAEGAEHRTPARVLFVTEGRTSGAFRCFVEDLVEHGGDPDRVRDVCMDMSPAYRRGAAETIPLAQITFDRFHVMKMVNDAVDLTRRAECKSQPELKGTRYDWLMNPGRLDERRRERLDGLNRRNLRTAKAYQMRLNLQELWECETIEQARQHLTKWCDWVKRVSCRLRNVERPWLLQHMRRVGRTIELNAEGILNYFRLRQTSAVLEGVNSLAQAARARARGYRNPATFQTMIYLIAGRLEFKLPRATHFK